MLEVMSIIMMVSVRSPMPPREFLGTCRVQSSQRKEISKDSIWKQVKSLRVPLFVQGRETERREHCLSHARRTKRPW